MEKIRDPYRSDKSEFDCNTRSAGGQIMLKKLQIFARSSRKIHKTISHSASSRQLAKKKSYGKSSNLKFIQMKMMYIFNTAHFSGHLIRCSLLFRETKGFNIMENG